MRIKRKTGNKGPKVALEVTLRQDNQTARGVVRKKGRRRGHREEASEEEKSMNWTERRARKRVRWRVWLYSWRDLVQRMKMTKRPE
jgi:hypothetical protein